MGFLKSKWRLLTFIVVCVGSVGLGGWAYMAGAAVNENVAKLSKVKSDVEAARRVSANSRVIEEKRLRIEKENAEFAKLMDAALSVQRNSLYDSLGPDGRFTPTPRQLLIENVLPKPTRAQAINFKEKYSEAFEQTRARLRARDKPTTREVTDEMQVLKSLEGGSQAMDLGPWGPRDDGSAKETRRRERPLGELLREYPRARASDRVARSIRMYAADNALGRHAKLLSTDVPTAVDIWQAQMSLWIQQDMVAVLAGMNEERVRELEKAGRPDDAWVAYMPIKHLIAVRIDSKLGKGGGSNLPRAWAASFTGIQNDDKLFKVPIQLEVVLEESRLIDLLDRLCRGGFYTPIGVNYDSIRPNPLLEDYIYGETPVIKAVIDLEGYYVRAVFEQWIPDELKKILRTPDAKEDVRP